MPRIDENGMIHGTINNVTFYMVNGKYYAKRKGVVSNTRRLKDPAFAKTRLNNSCFGTASKMTSELIKTNEAELKYSFLRNKLMGIAYKHLKEGKTNEETRELLLQYLKQEGIIKQDGKN